MKTLEDAKSLDESDPLFSMRQKFVLPKGVIYLDGNSLGPQPVGVGERLASVVKDEWGEDLIKSWNLHGWMDLPKRVGNKIGQLICAGEDNVIAADSTSVNLFKVLAAALSLRPDRKTVLSDTGNFPTDLYIAQGLTHLLKGQVELKVVPAGEIEDHLDETVAVLMLTQVDYRSGTLFDMKHMTEKAHDKGALALWDLSHSAGALPVDVTGCDVDFAVGCGYKYLNGGPGAPAFLYVHPKHQDQVFPPLSGWLGHEAPFAFDTDYRPADGIARQICGTPGILGMSALDTALDVFQGLDMDLIRHKSNKLTELFIDLVEDKCEEHGFELVTPKAPSQRGSQVSFRHPQGYAIMQSLIDHGVIGDFRKPDILRFGFAPLYTGYGETWEAAETLYEIMETQTWDRPEYHEMKAVT